MNDSEADLRHREPADGVSGYVTATFVYDGDGQRVKGTAGGVTTAYVGSHFEWTGSTTTMKRYYYAGGSRVAMRTGASTVNYLLSDQIKTPEIFSGVL